MFRCLDVYTLLVMSVYDIPQLYRYSCMDLSFGGIKFSPILLPLKLNNARGIDFPDCL